MLWAIFLGFPLPWIAILTGWFTAEVVTAAVDGLRRAAHRRCDDAISHLCAKRQISLVVFCTVYSFIFAFGIIYIYRLLRIGPAGRLIEPPVSPVPNRPMSVRPSPRNLHRPGQRVSMIMFWSGGARH